MTWDTIQQLIRIIMQVVSGMLVGKGIITEDLGVALIGGVLSLSQVAWWAFWQRTRLPGV
jgi:hypothetical protein